jgi:hypothetical protein
MGSKYVYPAPFVFPVFYYTLFTFLTFQLSIISAPAELVLFMVFYISKREYLTGFGQFMSKMG